MATAKENLELQLGKGNADAVVAYVDERLAQNDEQLEVLRHEVVELRKQEGDLPPELKQRLRTVVKDLGDLIDDHHELVNRRNSGEVIDKPEVVEEDARVKSMATDVESVRDDLVQRVNTLEDQVGRNDNEGLRRAVRDAQSTADEALRLAQSRGTTEARSNSKAVWLALLATFTVVFVFGWVWTWFSGDSLVWAVAWACVIAGLVAALVGAATKEGTRTNTFLGDFRDTRRGRQERQANGQGRVVERDVEERPAVVRRTEHTEQRERVNA